MFKFFTSDLRRNLIKILCLSVGLAVGFLLIAKIYFELSYDSFFPDVDRIYKIKYSAVHNGDYQVYDNTPGGIAPEVKRNISQVEVATRITRLTDDFKVKLSDGRAYEMPYVYLADTCFFDVFKADILEGNPHDALVVKDHVMIPQSLAKKIGGNVLGQQITISEWGDDYKMTIGGVYKDFPLNSTISNAVYLSLPSIGHFTFDGSEFLLGNDRYRSYVILTEDTAPDVATNLMYEHLKTKIDEEAFRLYDLKVVLTPLPGDYSSQEGVRNMSWMLGLLAVIMLLCAGLNYLLIVIGQLSVRGKEMAIRKCYGTDKKSIFKIMMGESLFFLLISMGLAILIAFSFSDLCKELLGYSPKELFSTGRVWIVEGLICVVLLIFTGVIPAIIYSRTPVSQAFRPAVHGRKIWKLVLLAVQFFATGLILCLLVLIGRQYAMVGTLDMGLDFENVGIFYRHPMSDERTSTVMKELQKLPFVESVATANNDPTNWQNGNNIWTEGKEEDNVNISDQELVNPELFDVFGIEFIQGSNFSENLDSTVNQIIVDEQMIEVLQKYFGETDGDIVGKSIYITGHGNGDGYPPLFTIVGVVGNIRRGGFESGNVDTRAEVFFPSKRVRSYVFIRFTELTPENLSAAQKVIDSISDGDEIYITPYKMRIDAKRHEIKNFGMSVMVVGVAIILIALIGLIGYVGDEVNRRAKEIAIRKVNGTSAKKIVRLFCIDVLKVAVPSLMAGGAVAIVIGQRWLSQFTDRVSISPLSMLACLLVLIILIMAVVVINTLRVARSNPIDHLRSE